MRVAGIHHELWAYGLKYAGLGVLLGGAGLWCLGYGASQLLSPALPLISILGLMLIGVLLATVGVYYVIRTIPWLQRASWVLQHAAPQAMWLTVRLQQIGDPDDGRPDQMIAALRAEGWGGLELPALLLMRHPFRLLTRVEDAPVTVFRDPNPGGPVLIRVGNGLLCSDITVPRGKGSPLRE